uniref:TPM domain-containing protein n=1 Tax=Cryptomonas curvata TaxID=233186 RepID=A0A7S0QMY4_9CRYP|nr:CMESO_411 [Cryptomonas curvata]|mmetsp:Transcript_43465/g.91033  ORF Transcript_43465/g.91033 Transcript_43465/m.91033 type:complete len:270 (+) Transcript_43465:19-828(+)
MHLNFISSFNKNFENKQNLFSKFSIVKNKGKFLKFSMNVSLDKKTEIVSFPFNLKPLINKSVNLLIPISIVFGSFNAVAVPDVNPKQNITDETGTLTKSSISYIEKSLTKIREVKQSEVYFVSVRNLPYGTDPQEYARDLFQKWELGSNDVIVVLVNKLAKAGIYYGNQVNTLTDEIVQSICNETYSFKAKDEQYSSAALDVNNRLVSILLGKGDPGSPSTNRLNSSSNFKSAKKTEESRSKYIAIIAILLIIAFVVPMVQFFYYVKDE